MPDRPKFHLKPKLVLSKYSDEPRCPGVPDNHRAISLLNREFDSEGSRQTAPTANDPSRTFLPCVSISNFKMTEIRHLENPNSIESPDYPGGPYFETASE